MQVWQKMNEIKGTNATKEQILNWMAMNRTHPNRLGQNWKGRGIRNKLLRHSESKTDPARSERYVL